MSVSERERERACMHAGADNCLHPIFGVYVYVEILLRRFFSLAGKGMPISTQNN